MSIKLSYFIADFFISQNWIKEEDKLVYVVGLDVVFSTIGQLFIIMLISMYRRRVVEAIIYLLLFLSVRKYCGGYHASTRIGCMALFTGMYLFADIVTVYICRSEMKGLLMLYGACSFLIANTIFYLFIPIKNTRKRYYEEQIMSARKKAFAYINIWNCLAVSLIFILPDIAGQIFSASNAVNLLILFCKPWRKKDE